MYMCAGDTSYYIFVFAAAGKLGFSKARELTRKFAFGRRNSRHSGVAEGGLAASG